MSNPMHGNQPKNNSSRSVKSADGYLLKTPNEENIILYPFIYSKYTFSIVHHVECINLINENQLSNSNEKSNNGFPKKKHECGGIFM